MVSPVLRRSQISAASSGVYLLGLPVFFKALETLSGVAAPLALTLGFEAAVARFGGFAAVSGMTLVLVRCDDGMVTESFIRRLVRGLAAQVRGTARSLCLHSVG